MTDKERLEELKLDAENNFFTGCPGDGTTFEFDEQVNWLIQQAEKAQKLELEVEQDERVQVLENSAQKAIEMQEYYLLTNGDLHDENKKFRFALKRIIEIRNNPHADVPHEDMYKVAREALEFYADLGNYDSWEQRSFYVDEPIHNVGMDHGDKARQALGDAE